MTTQELEAKIAALTAENERLKVNHTSTGTGLKISPKGALSVYGLGRFPVTLYQEQWKRLLAMAPDIAKFIAENSHALSVKPEKSSVKAV